MHFTLGQFEYNFVGFTFVSYTKFNISIQYFGKYSGFRCFTLRYKKYLTIYYK